MAASDMLEALNLLPSKEAETELLKCCGSREWAKRVVRERPFETPDELLAAAERCWRELTPADWLEAFRSHPRIGERKAEQQTSVEAQRWSAQEQSAAGNASADTSLALKALNRQYEEKFGYIFIVCASGKTAEEMLSILRRRLENSPEEELVTAAAEQAKITKLRIEKLLNP